MTSKKVTIKLESGLEARPVAMLVQVASQYDSDIYVESASKRINAKSIMGMMSLALGSGEERGRGGQRLRRGGGGDGHRGLIRAITKGRIWRGVLRKRRRPLWRRSLFHLRRKCAPGAHFFR